MHGVKYRSECLRSSCLHIPAVLGICVLTRVRGAFPHQLPTATLHNVGVPSSFSGGKTEARSLRSILWWSCCRRDGPGPGFGDPVGWAGWVAFKGSLSFGREWPSLWFSLSASPSLLPHQESVRNLASLSEGQYFEDKLLGARVYNYSVPQQGSQC